VRHPYVFIGLTPTEKGLLTSLFDMAIGLGDELVPVSRPEDAHLIVANGDDRAVVERLREHHPHALLVLVGQPPGAPVHDLPVLQRPLDMAGVTEVLSRLDWPAGLQSEEPTDFGESSPLTIPLSSLPASSLPPSRPAPPSEPPATLSSFAPTTASMPVTVTPAAAAPIASAVSARATWAVSERAPAHLTQAASHADSPLADHPGAEADLMVVVGALGRRSHTLPRGLRRLGFRVRLVEGADQALSAFACQPLAFVFLDQASLGEDVLPLARALGAQPSLAGGLHVVVVARRGTLFDRLRARLAGCAWIQVPVDRDRLLSFFARRGLFPGRD
jgi:hypothetical protein